MTVLNVKKTKLFTLMNKLYFYLISIIYYLDKSSFEISSYNILKVQ
jgi:hypothetical protein